MLFVQDQYQYLVKGLVKQDNFSVRQFANQEFSLYDLPALYDQKCAVIGSLTAPADQTIQLLMLLGALAEHKARQVILISPYLGYQRQDSCSPRISCGLRWADSLLSALKVNSIVTLEPHNPDSLINLKVPVVAYSSQDIFEFDMRRFVQQGFTFVFPDQGVNVRNDWIKKLFSAVDIGSFFKKRVNGIIELESFQGKFGKKIIIYDDILDSGQTLIQVCIALKQMGVQEIVIFVTHAFFNEQAWNDLWSLGVQALFCSNSTPRSDQMSHAQIHIKKIDFLLQKYV